MLQRNSDNPGDGGENQKRIALSIRSANRQGHSSSAEHNKKTHAIHADYGSEPGQWGIYLTVTQAHPRKSAQQPAP